MSDRGGTNSVVESVTAGCDLEMPGPAKWKARRSSRISAMENSKSRDVEQSALNVIHLIERTKGIKNLKEAPEKAD